MNLQAEESDLNAVSDAAWQRLSQKKICFGHQSVGDNILDGVRDIMQKNPKIKLDIIKIDTPANLKNGVFAHYKVGKNQNPQSKIDDFKRFMDEGIGNSADIAFFKFCFIDFNPKTNVQEVFKSYKDTVSRLKTKYPDTKIVHFTVPLSIKQTGPKAWIKKVLGKPVSGIYDNIKRHQYNELLKKEYGGQDALFDIAKIESTRPDGTRKTFEKDGVTYYSLTPAYTDDGAHLNKNGRGKVAQQLLLFLSDLK